MTAEQRETPVECIGCGELTRHVEPLCDACRAEATAERNLTLPRESDFARRHLPVQVGAEGRIIEPLACPECEYNLVTQPIESACPECGRSIEAMLAKQPLSLAPARWLGRLYLGSLLTLIGAGGCIAIFFLAMFAAVVVPMGLLLVVWALALFILAITFAVGLMRFFAVEPGSPRSLHSVAARIGWVSSIVLLSVIILYVPMNAMMFVWFAPEFVFLTMFIVAALTFLVSVSAGAYCLDTLYPRLKEDTPRLGGRVLKHLLAGTETGLCMVLALWILMQGLLTGPGEPWPLIVAMVVLYLLYLGLLIWLLILLLLRLRDFREAQRTARARVKWVVDHATASESASA